MWRTWLLTVSCEMKSRCGDVAVREAVGEELEDLALARREHVALVLAGEELRHQRRVDVALAGGDLLDRAHERLVRRLLEDVALRARLEPAAEQRALRVRGEDQHLRLGELLGEELRRLEPVHAGHADVHDHDVRLAAEGQLDRAAPSDASPTTRMCGARESERRSPSRTTSWSSTISVVISSAMDAGL